ncbi:PAS domain S-box protein, partial [Leptolyngbya sp. FACHB-36]|uniref:PAS domain-containing sensor histidine kinase n=1 Tax=Leptolyngbya sp. FACHB-36 TaxID=2692808 RepID=UPI001681802E
GLVKALSKERDLNSAVVDTAGSLILVLDRAGTIIQFNRTCERVTGYAASEVRGKRVWEVFSPSEDVNTVQQMVAKLRSAILPSEYEGDWLAKDGTRRRIAWSNTVLFDDRSSVSYIISTGLDITERTRAESALNETNQTLQALIQASPLSITLLDSKGNVELWNPAAERIFGWTAAEAIGNFMPSVPLEKRSEFQHNIEMALCGQFRNGVEVRRLRKDGSPVDISLWAAVIQGATREQDRVLSVVADVSDRKRAEAALQLSQERLTSFVEANIIGIIFGDVDGGIDEVNDEFLRLVGYSREDLSGNLRWDALTPADYRLLDADRIAEAKAKGACAPYEKAFIHKDGHCVPVLVGYSLLGDDQRQTIAFILDLTERHRLEQALRDKADELSQVNRLKDEFLAVLSHELRTPLNAILGWSQILRKRQIDPVAQGRALETIERSAKLQTQLIDDILDVSKIIRGKLRLQPKPMILTPVIDAAIDSMRPAAAAKCIHLDAQLDPNINEIYGDPDRLQQVVWNLLSNAIKFTPERGRVTVKLSETEDGKPLDTSTFNVQNSDSPRFVEITIIDSGRGIAPDFLPFVFDRFRQADSTTTRAAGGLGLGLAIVRHLVELHGGTVEAASDGIGLGAVFTVKLPILRMRVLAEDLTTSHNPAAVSTASESLSESLHPRSFNSLH